MSQVSVVIPAYNASATLDRTLASVCAQTHSDLEIIVVDDGSTDNTAAIARHHMKSDTRIRVSTKENGGVSTARNHGIELATNDWVAPIDADDIWHPRTIEGFLSAAQSMRDSVAFVYTWSRRIDQNDHLIEDLGRPHYSGDVMPQLLASNFTNNASATMLNRAATLTVGGYDSKLLPNGAEDIDFYLRLAKVGKVAVSHGYHVGYRHMPNSMSQNANRQRNFLELVLEKVERENTDLRPELFSLARTNYDLYAAGLSLAAGSWADMARYSISALRRDTILACVYLSILGPYRLITSLKSRQMPVFQELEPDLAYSWPIRDRLMSLQDLLYRRVFRTPRMQKT